ncbi:E3 ubiquitin-protein ligase RNF14-like isoform X2 [Artemia franciscana]|uniref:E3 ubiquitin-protein ligase RNF14-like isoform X2 n=1 Tax=Artemia franciscana TaxID=6661 RepID=UPI0032DA08E0
MLLVTGTGSMEQDIESQKEEIEVLRSIFLDESLEVQEGSENRPIIGRIAVKVQKPGDTFEFYFERDQDWNKQLASVNHLPPINLHFVLPYDYPSVHAPRFVLSCSWLGRKELSRLCYHLDRLWNENQGFQILFVWANFLSEDTFSVLNLQSPCDLTWIANKQWSRSRRKRSIQAKKSMDGYSLDVALTYMHNSQIEATDSSSLRTLDRRAVNTLCLSDNILVVLTDYDSVEKIRIFNTKYHTCKVCFSDKPGRLCFQFPNCLHVYCNSCIKSYFEVKIQDGEVRSLKCPEEKCESQPTAAQVRGVLDREMFTKYDTLLLSSTLATPNTIYCPRESCQYPISLEEDSDLASCPSCQFNSCVHCQMTFHGVEPCKYKNVGERDMFKLYRDACGDEKLDLEKRYGKKQLQNLVERVLSEDWIEEFSKACPHCKAKIEKSDGCNKMICWKCFSS